ncbi:MoaD/ThiS family protein [bacterium]|jgi:molybdopterin synthase sulfur carrier subunit|nr:MoaD/ThiS family protein [bacterium]
MAIVKIPTPLRRLTGEKDEVLTSSNSVSEMIDDLESQFPGIKDRLCDENGGIRKFINIYINEEDIRFLDGPKTQINEKDTVSIIPAIAGGTSVN